MLHGEVTQKVSGVDQPVNPDSRDKDCSSLSGSSGEMLIKCLYLRLLSKGLFEETIFIILINFLRDIHIFID